MLTLWFGLAVAAPVILGIFTWWLVAPIAVAGIVSTWRLMPTRIEANPRSLIGSLVAVLGAVVWAIIQAPFASEYVFVNRDPGFYELSALWLTNHSSSRIPLGGALQAIADVPHASVEAAAFTQAGDSLQVQGNSLVPGVLAVAGWLGGIDAIRVAAIVIGALAIVALYALARRIAGPLWAIVPIAAMAISIPMAFFSRSPYSEPLAMVYTFGALVLAHSALKSRKSWQLVLAGLALGAAALARIDAMATIAGAAAALGLAMVAIPGRAVRGPVRRAYRQFCLAALIPALLAIIDLLLNSRRYLRDHLLNLAPLWLVAIAIAAFCLWASASERPSTVQRVAISLTRRRDRWGRAAGLAVLAIAIILISRPLWYQAHFNSASSPGGSYIEAMQAEEGLTSDGSRSYDEFSLWWVAWYFGWPAVVAGLAGLALIVRRAISHRDPRLFMFAGTIGFVSLMYFVKVSITPDQVWAMRRLLNVAIPGLLISAAWLLAQAWHRWAHAWTRALTILLALAIALFPITTWGVMFDKVEHAGRLGQLDAACSAITGDRVIAATYGQREYLASLRVGCDVDVVSFPSSNPTQADLAKIAAQWPGTGPITVLTFEPEDVPWVGDAVPSPWSVDSISEWENPLMSIPKTSETTVEEMFVGTLRPDGLVQGTNGHGDAR